MQDKDNSFSLTIEQLVERYHIAEQLNGNFIMTSRLPDYIGALSFPLRVEAFLIAVCVQGSITVSVNTQQWAGTANTCFISLPENVMGVVEVSPDYKGYIVAISLEYLKMMNIDLKDIIPYYILVRNYPRIEITPAETERLSEFFELISVSLQEKESSRKEEIIKGLFSALVYKVCECIDRANIPNRQLKTKSKEFYFIRFMELLWKDFRSHRNVKYYSDRLSVTPKYLSLLIKNISGTSAAEWIDLYTIMEASILLKFSDKSIQQIADELNFPNQSFFSKYFKHHTEQTPSEYRESNRKRE